MHQDNPEYFLVDKRVLPEVFIKVMEVKQRLNTGESTSVNEAVRKTGLSRSAYYKYKDSVLPFYEAASGKKVTLLLSVENFQGILSEIIRTIAESRANILTINQNKDVFIAQTVHTQKGTHTTGCHRGLRHHTRQSTVEGGDTLFANLL